MSTHPAIESANLLTDNPELYELRFPDPDHRAVRFVTDLIARHGVASPARILDLGSGTGRDAGRLAGLGHTVTGVDVSARMVDHARRTWPRAEFLHGDMRSLRSDRVFDVVTCLDSALLYCHTNTDLAAALAGCARLLSRGGLFVAEMRNGAFFLGGGDELLNRPQHTTVTWNQTPYTAHTELWIDHGAQLLRRRRRWEWPGGGPLEQRSAWRLLFPQELRYFLERAGLRPLALFDGPGPRTEPPWHASAEPWPTLSGDRLHVVARRD